MTKKILIALIILFATLFLSNTVFAESAIENGMKDIGSEVKESWDKMGGAVQNVGNNVKGAVNNMEDAAGNAMNGNNNDKHNDNQNKGIMNIGNNGYTATRTSTGTENNVLGMNSTAWTWAVIIVLAVAIVSLIWYYDAQKTNEKRNK